MPTTSKDLVLDDRALDTFLEALGALAATPFLFRSPGRALRREVVVSIGSGSYVLQYEIAGPALVVVLAVRHQREEDRH